MQERNLILPVRGMTCASCVAHVEKALKGVDGVANVTVNLSSEKATVQLDPEATGIGSLVEAVRETGYEIPTETVTLSIGGMTCASCTAHVERALSKVPGVVTASVNLASEKATVTFVPGVAGLSDFRRAVAEAGYEVVEAPTEALAEAEQEDEAERKMRKARLRMRVAWAFTAPIVVWMLAEMLLGVVWPNPVVFNLGMVLLALPVLLWVGRRTYRSGFTPVVHGYANMDTLIALGTGVSLLTGPTSFFFPVANYAGVAAMVMAFHLTGRYVEETAKGRASQAIQTLKDVKVIVFDKTGTLTKGKPEVTDIVAAVHGFDEGAVLRAAASAERGSEHPLGRAIVERAEVQGLSLAEPQDFRAIRGKGVMASVNGDQILVGSRRLMREHGLDSTPLEETLRGLEAEAKTAMLVSVGDRVAGVVAVADTLKEDSIAAIQELHRMGLETAMITGDNRRTGEAIARQVGIDHVLAEVLPDGKAAEVQTLQERFGRVWLSGAACGPPP